jgi:insertion element IS1 protein InsB
VRQFLLEIPGQLTCGYLNPKLYPAPAQTKSLALHLAETRLIVGCAIGPRDKQTAEDRWYSLPPDYRQRAVCYTNFLQAYASVLPSKRHQAVDKASGKTSHSERLNNTSCQRCSRRVRKTLSLSKKLANHIGAMGYFIHYYNACILACLARPTTST